MTTIGDKLKAFREELKNGVLSGNERIEFIVPDADVKEAASRALDRVRIPETPHLKALGEAYVAGDRIVRSLNPREIKVVERRGLSRDDAYRANEQTIRRLVEHRDAIVAVVEKMVNPLIRVVGNISIGQQSQFKKLAEYEKRITELERMMAEVYGRAPVVPPLPGGKAVWGSTLKEAAAQIMREYDEDCRSNNRRFRSLRDASDDFHRRHLFVHKPNLTSDQLYENVKKL